jgi:hypothetical protein
VARIVLRGVAAGKTVEIDGLGIFYPDSRRGFRFQPRTLPQVFIAYGKEDEPLAARLYEELNRAGFNPWMDVRKLPGRPELAQAISRPSKLDFFVACFRRDRAQERRLQSETLRYSTVLGGCPSMKSISFRFDWTPVLCREPSSTSYSTLTCFQIGVAASIGC